jgi:hypothetical protein
VINGFPAISKDFVRLLSAPATLLCFDTIEPLGLEYIGRKKSWKVLRSKTVKTQAGAATRPDEKVTSRQGTSSRHSCGEMPGRALHRTTQMTFCRPTTRSRSATTLQVGLGKCDLTFFVAHNFTNYNSLKESRDVFLIFDFADCIPLRFIDSCGSL